MSGRLIILWDVITVYSLTCMNSVTYSCVSTSCSESQPIDCYLQEPNIPMYDTDHLIIEMCIRLCDESNPVNNIHCNSFQSAFSLGTFSYPLNLSCSVLSILYTPNSNYSRIPLIWHQRNQRSVGLSNSTYTGVSTLHL
jgi:hypothetical protein